MARNRNRKRPIAPFKSISDNDLEFVVGGRIAVAKGPDPQVIAGIKTMAESVGLAGQAMEKKKQEQAGMMQQMMGMMQQRR